VINYNISGKHKVLFSDGRAAETLVSVKPDSMAGRHARRIPGGAAPGLPGRPDDEVAELFRYARIAS
jgi:hypothetical protein